MPPVVDENKCDGCGICDLHCPVDVLLTDREARLVRVKYPLECWYCGVCRLDCPQDAISFYFPEKMACI